MNNLALIPSELQAEFFCDLDGKVYAKSWRAIARLAGVSDSTFHDRRADRVNILDKILLAKQLPNSLKPLAGKDLRVLANIPDTVVTSLLEYYAFDFKGNTEQAKLTYRAFAGIGFRAWMQTQLGFKQTESERFDKLESLMSEMLNELREWKQVDIALAEQPGLQEIIETYKAEQKIIESQGFTLSEWLTKRNIKTTHAQKIKFSNRVSHTFRTHYRAKPHKALRNGNKICLYLERHNALIEAAFKECFLLA